MSCGPVQLAAAAHWLPGIAVDGKAVRGAAGPDGLIPYLLAAATHDACAVIAERLTGPKTSEMPELAPLLRELSQHYCADQASAHPRRPHQRIRAGRIEVQVSTGGRVLEPTGGASAPASCQEYNNCCTLGP